MTAETRRAMQRSEDVQDGTYAKTGLPRSDRAAPGSPDARDAGARTRSTGRFEAAGVDAIP